MTARSKRALRSSEDLPPFDEKTGVVLAIVDTPKGSRNKFKFDEERGLFNLAGVLPAGASFPFDFGFIPSTRGEDGDALDILLLMDEPAFVGCLVEARLLGVIAAEQTEEGKTERNDRLIGVADASRSAKHLRALDDLPEPLIAEIEHFFVSYNEAKGKRFEPTGRYGPQAARRRIEAGAASYRKPAVSGRRPKSSRKK